MIGMEGEIGDDAAVEFSAGFYDAITAGEPYGRCFDIGVNAVDLANLTDIDRPTLLAQRRNQVSGSGAVIFTATARASAKDRLVGNYDRLGDHPRKAINGDDVLGSATLRPFPMVR